MAFDTDDAIHLAVEQRDGAAIMRSTAATMRAKAAAMSSASEQIAIDLLARRSIPA